MTERKITILQINDLHGYIEPHPEVFRGRGRFSYRTCGGLARIATVFRQVRAERPGAVLALDNGDTFHGTFVAINSQGSALVPLMNALAFDAMTAHWEFAYGPAQFRQLAAQLSYPVLAINCYEAESDRLAFAPSRVVERGGLRIGIIGIASNIVDKSMPPSYSKGLKFSLGNTELPAHIERLRTNDRVDLIVVLSHLGFAQDCRRRRRFDPGCRKSLPHPGNVLTVAGAGFQRVQAWGSQNRQPGSNRRRRLQSGALLNKSTLAASNRNWGMIRPRNPDPESKSSLTTRKTNRSLKVSLIGPPSEEKGA